MKDYDFGESYVVLYKIGCIRPNQPNLCRGMLQVQSYVVLYKRGDAALPIELPLSLTVALSSFGMGAPVGLLIVGVLGAPLLSRLSNTTWAYTGSDWILRRW